MSLGGNWHCCCGHVCAGRRTSDRQLPCFLSAHLEWHGLLPPDFPAHHKVPDVPFQWLVCLPLVLIFTTFFKVKENSVLFILSSLAPLPRSFSHERDQMLLSSLAPLPRSFSHERDQMPPEAHLCTVLVNQLCAVHD